MDHHVTHTHTLKQTNASHLSSSSPLHKEDYDYEGKRRNIQTQQHIKEQHTSQQGHTNTFTPKIISSYLPCLSLLLLWLSSSLVHSRKLCQRREQGNLIADQGFHLSTGLDNKGPFAWPLAALICWGGFNVSLLKKWCQYKGAEER